MYMPTEEFNNGFILYVGAMFGGKTAQAIMDAQRAVVANKKVCVFKTSWDNRYSDTYLTANNEQLKFPSISVPHLDDLIRETKKKNPEILIIDEIQFFDERIYDYILNNKKNMRIIATGLQMDYRGNSFPLRDPRGKEYDSEKIKIGTLMGISTKVKQFWPICVENTKESPCDSAYYNQRINEDGNLSKYSEQTVVIGATNKYRAVCDKHFIRPISNDKFLTPNGEIINYENTRDYIEILKNK